MIFYKYRKDLKLLFKGLLSKFDFVRAKKAFMLFNNNDIINDIAEIINKYIFDDNDDQKDDRASTDDITSLSINEQNNDLRELISERDSYQAIFNHHKKDPQPRLSDNDNKGFFFSQLMRF